MSDSDWLQLQLQTGQLGVSVGTGSSVVMTGSTTTTSDKIHSEPKLYNSDK